MKELLMIRNKDGLFSTGGCYPQFTKNGKTWSSRALNCHLVMVRDYGSLGLYNDCEVVIFTENRSESLSKKIALLNV